MTMEGESSKPKVSLPIQGGDEAKRTLRPFNDGDWQTVAASGKRSNTSNDKGKKPVMEDATLVIEKDIKPSVTKTNTYSVLKIEEVKEDAQLVIEQPETVAAQPAKQTTVASSNTPAKKVGGEKGKKEREKGKAAKNKDGVAPKRKQASVKGGKATEGETQAAAPKQTLAKAEKPLAKTVDRTEGTSNTGVPREGKGERTNADPNPRTEKAVREQKANPTKGSEDEYMVPFMTNCANVPKRLFNHFAGMSEGKATIGLHGHPELHYCRTGLERVAVRNMMLNEYRTKVKDYQKTRTKGEEFQVIKINILDVGGIAHRTGRIIVDGVKQGYHSIQPQLSPSDVFKNITSRNTGFDFCECLAQDCVHIAKFKPDTMIMVHSIYYFTPDEIAELIDKTTYKKAHVVYHEFRQSEGYFPSDLEKPDDWEMHYVMSGDEVTAEVRGNGFVYKHPSMQWMNDANNYKLKDGRHLVWSEKRDVYGMKYAVFTTTNHVMKEPATMFKTIVDAGSIETKEIDRFTTNWPVLRFFKPFTKSGKIIIYPDAYRRLHSKATHGPPDAAHAATLNNRMALWENEQVEKGFEVDPTIKIATIAAVFVQHQMDYEDMQLQIKDVNASLGGVSFGKPLPRFKGNEYLKKYWMLLVVFLIGTTYKRVFKLLARVTVLIGTEAMRALLGRMLTSTANNPNSGSIVNFIDGALHKILLAPIYEEAIAEKLGFSWHCMLHSLVGDGLGAIYLASELPLIDRIMVHMAWNFFAVKIFPNIANTHARNAMMICSGLVTTYARYKFWYLNWFKLRSPRVRGMLNHWFTTFKRKTGLEKVPPKIVATRIMTDPDVLIADYDRINAKHKGEPGYYLAPPDFKDKVEKPKAARTFYVASMYHGFPRTPSSGHPPGLASMYVRLADGLSTMPKIGQDVIKKFGKEVLVYLTFPDKPVEVLPMRRWLKEQCGRQDKLKQRQYESAISRLEEGVDARGVPLHGEFQFYATVFTKNEGAMNKGDNNKTRGIFNPRPDFTVRVSPGVYAAQKNLFAHWKANEHEYNILVSSGCSADEVAKWFTDALAAIGGDGLFIEMDFSRFEANWTKESMDYIYSMWLASELIDVETFTLLMSTIKFEVRGPDNKTWLRRLGGHGSGKPDTTLINSVGNFAHFYLVCRTLGMTAKEIETLKKLFLGDDNLIAVPGHLAHYFYNNDLTKLYLEYFGWEVKLKLVPASQPYNIEFCSCWFVANGKGGHIWTPKLGRVLAKTFTIKGDAKGSEIMGGVVRGLAHFGNSYLLSLFLYHLDRKINPDLSKLKLVWSEYAHTPKSSNKAIVINKSEKAIEQEALRYGMTVAEVHQLAKELVDSIDYADFTVGRPVIIKDTNLWNRVCTVDYPIDDDDREVTRVSPNTVYSRSEGWYYSYPFHGDNKRRAELVFVRA